MLLGQHREIAPQPPTIDLAGGNLAPGSTTWTALPQLGETTVSAGDPRRDLDYMHARYRSPLTGRFLSVDPSGRSIELDSPQSWNRYAYSYGNPLKFVDPDGASPIKYLVKALSGLYHTVGRPAAVRAAARRAHAVKVTGRGASQEARRVAREANPESVIVRHDPHQPGDLPHFQPKNGGRGHVAYDPETLVLAIAGVGAAAASSVEAATGSELLGDATGLAIDFFNPAQDIQAAESLLEAIATDAIGAAYGVDLNDDKRPEGDCDDKPQGCTNSDPEQPD